MLTRSQRLPRFGDAALYRASILRFLRDQNFDEVEIRLLTGERRAAATAVWKTNGHAAGEAANELALFIALAGKTVDAEVIGRKHPKPCARKTLIRRRRWIRSIGLAAS